MFLNFRKPARVLASAAVLSGGLGLITLVNSAPTAAHADPSYEIGGQPVACTGSDTVNDIFDSFAGQAPSPGPEPTAYPKLGSKFYTPLHSAVLGSTGLVFGDTTNGETIASFDATDPHQVTPGTLTGDDQYITTKLNGTTFDRPNGSGDGRKSLDDAIEGNTWENSNNTANVQSVSAQIDCARSSSIAGSATASTSPGDDMSYIPFASDEDGYAYHCASTTSVDCNLLTHLPSSVFFNLFSPATGGVGTGDGILAPGQGGWPASATTDLKACAINVGSGTFQFFLHAVNLGSDYRANAQTNLTNATMGSQCTQVEENNLNTFLSDSVTADTSGIGTSSSDWVIPTSVGNDTGQHNGLALDRSSQFWTSTGGDTAGDGLAVVADGVTSYTLGSAVSSGATSLTLDAVTPTDNFEADPTAATTPQVGATLTLDYGTANQENVTVTSVTGSSSPYTVGVSATTKAHGAASDVNFGEPYLGDGTATWTPLDAYAGSIFGRYLFVLVPSSEIVSSGANHAVEDLFYSPAASGGTAAICSGQAQTQDLEFGFDPALPNNGTEQNGAICGNVLYIQTGAS